ncbi:MAG TPA: DUF4129 domain-containing protein [Acidimicrobiales bacterium]
MGLLAVGTGILACAVVAVAAAGEPLRGASSGTGRLSISPWFLVIPVAALAALAVLGLAGVRGVRGGRRSSKRSLWLTVLGLIVLVAVLSRWQPSEPTAPDEPPTLEVAPPRAPSESPRGSWGTWLVIGAAGSLAVGAVLLRRHQRGSAAQRCGDTDLDADPSAAALRTVEASLIDLADPADPRQAVIAAYARLLEGLQDVGVGRAPSEAPFEHVTRVLGALGVRPEPLRELTALFAEARFSAHPITEDRRRAALRALEDARADLQGVTV